MYKINLSIPEICEFTKNLETVLDLRRAGKKGFKRTLFYRMDIEKDTTICVIFKNYVASADKTTGLFNTEELLTVEENVAFLSLIEDEHLRVLADIGLDVMYSTQFDMVGNATPTVVSEAILKDLCKIEFKRHQPANIYLPMISFSITDNDFETDRTLWNKLRMIQSYLLKLERVMEQILWRTEGGYETKVQKLILGKSAPLALRNGYLPLDDEEDTSAAQYAERMTAMYAKLNLEAFKNA